MSQLGFFVLTDHVCRACLGRVLQQTKVKGRVFQCADCGLSSTVNVEAICPCGIRNQVSGKDMRMRCVTNPHQTRQVPSQIIVTTATADEGMAVPPQFGLLMLRK